MTSRSSVDDAYVPRPLESAYAVEAGNEALLVDEATDLLHVLNPTGALVWACLDGASSLAEICGDLAEGLGVPYETVLTDTIAIVEELDTLGVVSDARAPQPVLTRLPTVPPGAPDARSPSAALDRHFESGRATTIGVLIDGRVVGVRSNDPSVLAELRAAVATLVVEDPQAAPDLSLLVAEPLGRLRQSHFLYRGANQVLATPSTGRLLRAALAHLEAFLPPPSHAVALQGRLLVGAHGAVVAVAPTSAWLDLPDVRVSRFGWRAVDTPRVLVDPNTFEVVVSPLSLDVDAAAIAELDARHPRGEDEPATSVGRYPVRALVAVAYDPDDETLSSPAQALRRLVPFVLEKGGTTRGRDLDVVHRLAERCGVHWVAGTDPDALPELLRGLAWSAPR